MRSRALSFAGLLAFATASWAQNPPSKVAPTLQNIPVPATTAGVRGLSGQAPLPLPILGQYVKDRVSIADPSGAASEALVHAPRKPRLDSPSPFSPWNLPDPFENAAVVRLREVWAENPDLPRLIALPAKR